MRWPRTIGDDSLLREPSFAPFWFAHTVSEAGSRITFVVAPILVYQLTGSALNTGILAALQAVPYLLFGLIAGATTDRANRRRVMVGCNVAQAGLLASIPLAAATDSLGVVQIYVVAVLSASLFVWFDAANFGALPMLVGRDRLVEANSAIWAASSVVAVAGPAVGGVLAATMGPANAIGLDAASYALSALALVFVRKPLSSKRTDGTALEPLARRIVADIREGLHYLWNQRLVRTLTLLGFGDAFTAGAVTGLLVVFSVRALGTSEDGAEIGLLYSVGAAGGLASALLLPRMNRRYPVGWITLAGLSTVFLCTVALALTTQLALALAVFFAFNAGQTLVIINGISLRQQVTPLHLQGRVNVSARMVAWGGMPFGAAIGGALAQIVSIRTTYLVMAVGVGLSTLIGWYSPLRTRAGTQTLSTSDASGSAR